MRIQVLSTGGTGIRMTRSIFPHRVGDVDVTYDTMKISEDGNHITMDTLLMIIELVSNNSM